MQYVPCPGLQGLKQNKNCGFVVAVEKLEILDIRDLLVKLSQVYDIGGHNGRFAVKETKYLHKTTESLIISDVLERPIK